MGVTLRQVAQEARVSLATASRAFRTPHLLAADTRQRVVEAGVRLGYSMPAALRARSIAVVVPDISNPTYATQIKILQEKLWPGRHRMVLLDTGEDAAREIECLERVSDDVDGVILCSPLSDAHDAQRAIGATPLVIHNGASAGSPVVIMDVEPGLRQALEHLQSLGHKGIAYIPGPAASWANSTRKSALERLTAERGMSLAVVENQSANVQGGIAATAAVLATGATAVVAYSDFVAIGLQAGLRARLGGSRMMGIVGIDDVDIAASVVPSLTTIRLDIERSIALSLEFLMDLIEGNPSHPGPAVRFGSQLIVRDSTPPVQFSTV